MRYLVIFIILVWGALTEAANSPCVVYSFGDAWFNGQRNFDLKRSGREKTDYPFYTAFCSINLVGKTLVGANHCFRNNMMNTDLNIKCPNSEPFSVPKEKIEKIGNDTVKVDLEGAGINGISSNILIPRNTEEFKRLLKNECHLSGYPGVEFGNQIKIPFKDSLSFFYVHSGDMVQVTYEIDQKLRTQEIMKSVQPDAPIVSAETLLREKLQEVSRDPMTADVIHVMGIDYEKPTDGSSGGGLYCKSGDKMFLMAVYTSGKSKVTPVHTFDNVLPLAETIDPSESSVPAGTKVEVTK